MSHIVRLHLCVACTCTAQVCGAVRESSPSSLCLVVVVLWLGRCEGSTRKVSSLPTLRGGSSRSRRTSHLDRAPGCPCRKSPGLFVLSLSHSLECSSSRLSIHTHTSASLNANADGESTTAGGLEAASSNACGRVDPQRGPWNFNTMSSQRGTHELDNPRLRR